MKLFVAVIFALCAVSVMASSCPNGNMQECASVACTAGYAVKCVNQICTCAPNLKCSTQQQCMTSGHSCARPGGWHCADNLCLCGNCV